MADRRTSAIYEAQADAWIGRRGPVAVEDGRLDRFTADLAPGARVADLGSGPAWYAAAFKARGFRTVAIDLSLAMLRRAPEHLARVRADLLELPLRAGSLDAAWAINCYQHLPLGSLPLGLVHLHRALRIDAPLEMTLARMPDDVTPQEHRLGEAERRSTGATGNHPGRLFSHYSKERIRTLLEGAGFSDIGLTPLERHFWISISARRDHTLPDFIAPGLRLLVCGLNPSLHAAESGVPFVYRGNRFWAAAQKAGIVARDRDPLHALASGVGFTDLAKRATPRAAELTADEYRSGRARVEALVRHFEPRAICFVGLDGWRRSGNPRAAAGWIEAGFGGAPAYLMPSTSGLNAGTRLEELAQHIARAAQGP